MLDYYMQMGAMGRDLCTFLSDLQQDYTILF